MLIARLTAILLVIFSSTLQVRANGNYEDPSEYSFFGKIFVLPGEQNIAWLFGEIENGDYFNFRRMLRRYEIDTLVLGSPGGSVFESLQIAAMVHDLNISTYIPTGAACASACANIFFAGPSRHADGQLGVHQFYTTSNTGSLDEVQFTVSEILGFLNEFGTPPMVYERMFESGEMYYFSDADLVIINRDQNPDSSRRLGTNYRSSLQETYQAVLEALSNYEEGQTARQAQQEDPVLEAPVITQPSIDMSNLIPFEISLSCDQYGSPFSSQNREIRAIGGLIISNNEQYQFYFPRSLENRVAIEGFIERSDNVGHTGGRATHGSILVLGRRLTLLGAGWPSSEAETVDGHKVQGTFASGKCRFSLDPL